MILLVIVSCVLCFVYAWIRRRKYLAGELPPASLGTRPIVGHLHLWLKGSYWNRLLEMQNDCLAKGCITYSYSGTNPSYTYYALCDPEDCNTVAIECSQKAYLLDNCIRNTFGEGLATASVSVWEKHRPVLEPVFHQICNLELMVEHSKELVISISDKPGKGLFDPTEYLRRTVGRILFSTIFGVIDKNDCADKVDHIETYQSAMVTLSRVLFERFQSYFLHKKLFFYCSTLRREQEECMNVMKNISKKMITMRRDWLNKNPDYMKNMEDSSNTSQRTLLDELIKLEGQGIYSEEQVLDEVNTAMYSGHDTMVNSLIFVLVMLGSHPSVQDKVFIEVEKQHDNIKNDLDMNDLSKLVYLEAVILESLRLFPAVPTISRTVSSSMVIKKYSLEPGTQCLLYIYAMNRHQSWGADRESFRPERWLDGTRLPDHGFATFGVGKRSCVGKNLSLAIMKVILRQLLREYKLISDHTKMVVTHKIMLTPVSGYHVALERRESATGVLQGP